MFATLLGSLPRPPLPADAGPEALLAAVVRAQELAGLEPVSDAGFGIGDSAVGRWRATSALTDRPVKTQLPGPCSTGQSVARAIGPVLEKATIGAAESLHADLLELAAAGCELAEVHEPAAMTIGADREQRELFRRAHVLSLDGVTGMHLSLAITGGNADAAVVEMLLAAPYASLAVDLIAGPDNWRLVAATPGNRGIICGALSTVRNSDDRPEIMLWAADYAASMHGRGRSRVGLSTAGSLAGLPWEVAVRKLGILGEAARFADLPPAQRRQRMAPQAVDIRSAALGRVDPRPTRRRRLNP